MADIALIGGGGHALVAYDCALSAGLDVIGFYDDASDAPLSSRTARLGGLAAALGGSGSWLLALGDLATRRRVLGSADGSMAVSARHRGALVSSSARVGVGVVIAPGAVVNAMAVLGDHAIINSGAVVEHECEIGENAHIAPGAVLGGRVAVGDDALVGLGARVLPGLSVGAGCIVGAGAVVTRPVEGGWTVAGNPARRLA